jgi:phasin family protein
MYTTPELFTASNKANAEAFLDLAKTQFAAFEKLTALNVNAARSALEESTRYTRALLSAKDPQEMINLNAASAQPALEKALSYSRGLYEISAQAQGELTKVFEAHTAEVTRNMASLLDKFARSAPAGSDVAVAAVKSALSAANSAYDSFSRVAKQASEMAQANFTAVAAAAREPHKKAA